jgi:hypothetical protein
MFPLPLPRRSQGGPLSPFADRSVVVTLDTVSSEQFSEDLRQILNDYGLHATLRTSIAGTGYALA